MSSATYAFFVRKTHEDSCGIEFFVICGANGQPVGMQTGGRKLPMEPVVVGDLRQHWEHLPSPPPIDKSLERARLVYRENSS